MANLDIGRHISTLDFTPIGEISLKNSQEGPIRAKESAYFTVLGGKKRREVKKMRKLITVAIMVMFVLAMLSTAYAGPSGQAGKSNIAQLYLVQKDPMTWEPVVCGAWGKMTYEMSGSTFDFVFNGHGLEAGVDYTLIYYGDPWPGDHPGAYIANATTNAGGNVHMRDSVELNMDLPDSADANYPDGAKIWLVKSSDYDAENSKMTAWNPDEYLFEYQLMTFNDTDI